MRSSCSKAVTSHTHGMETMQRAAIPGITVGLEAMNRLNFNTGACGSKQYFSAVLSEWRGVCNLVSVLWEQLRAS